MRFPSQVYQHSTRKYRGGVEHLDYPQMHTRRVNQNGKINWGEHLSLALDQPSSARLKASKKIDTRQPKKNVTLKNKSVTHVLNQKCYLCPDCACAR
jgi:hypothetical protein